MTKTKSKTLRNIKLWQLAFAASAVIQLVIMIINTVNGNIHVDEAMTILNARSLADSTTDILGERLPVYFDTWLQGGQSPFATYLMALFIKVFGYSLFVSRLPMLMSGLFSLFLFYFFLKEILPDNQELVNIVYLFACFSPCQFYNTSFTLDCNFLPHILLIGMYFLARAINTGKTKFYAISMVFFAVGFYCYMLSVVIIPVFLASLYIILIFSKKISLKNVIVSIAVIFAAAIPFILSGLVQFKIIDSFTLFGFSFSEMPYYTRGLQKSFYKIIVNLVYGIISAAMPDIYIAGTGTNSFLYTNFIGGIFFLLGIVYLLTAKARGRLEKAKTALVFIVPALVSAIVVCATSYFTLAMYRFNSYNFIFFVVMGFGVYYCKVLFKKLNIRKMMCVFLSVSLIMFSGVWDYYYHGNNTNKNYFYIDSFINALDFTQKLNCESTGICFIDDTINDIIIAEQLNSRNSIALRYYFYGKKELIPLDKEYFLFGFGKEAFGKAGNTPVTDDASIYYTPLDDSKEIDDNCLIIFNDQLDAIKYDKKLYKSKSFDNFIVLYKTGL